jgi:hypothetical protein
MLSAVLMIALSAPMVAADDLPKGQVVDEVPCQAVPSQTYSLYLPSTYTTDRAWPVIYVFDPGARGANAVERFRAAAEEYGYIVAASNNSRNGRPNADAVVNMPADVAMRFHVDSRRMYTAGLSGGARVALGVALEGKVAGVFAASAGYPDAAPRKALPFVLFATTGTEDFNHLELHTLDRALTTPHRLEVFDGGHAWPPAEDMLEGVEWLDIQAMRSKLKPRDEMEIDRIFGKRLMQAEARSGVDQYTAFRALAADFQGLRDVAALTARAAALARSAVVVDGLKRERDEDEKEDAIVTEVQAAEHRLESSTGRTAAMVFLVDKWDQLARAARLPGDSADRRIARRAMAWLWLNTLTMDDEYREMVREIRSGVPAR